jgi:hypothetical protein
MKKALLFLAAALFVVATSNAVFANDPTAPTGEAAPAETDTPSEIETAETAAPEEAEAAPAEEARLLPEEPEDNQSN